MPDIKKTINLIAILGPTASGKSDLSMSIAQKIDAEIFSLDSLSIYQEIDIASAKPKKEQLKAIRHYGIDELSIPESNNAMIFKNLLDSAIFATTKKTLLITGGSSFYLKAIIEGLSPMPVMTLREREDFSIWIEELKNDYEFLCQIDPIYASKIKSNDVYRIHKALEIYFSTKLQPSFYFQIHPKIPFSYPVKIYAIKTDRKFLRESIYLRTCKMLDLGVVDEIASLKQKYPLDSQPFKAIGPKECIAYLEGKIHHIDELKYLISTHTAQLAKRQDTFNRTQFKDIFLGSREEIYESILSITKGMA